MTQDQVSKPRVMVVEDERIIARGIEKRLVHLGYEVVASVGSGEEAVSRAQQGDLDIILMDINLGPGITGIEAADRIRREVDVPVVFLTAHSDSSTLERAKQSEPFGYILKPYEERELKTTIEIVLYRHQMEKRVRRNEQWLASTLTSMGDGVIATDPQGAIRLINQAAEDITGWSAAQAMSLPIDEVLLFRDERDGLPVPNPIWQAMSHDRVVNLPKFTVLIDKQGQERAVDDSAAPIRGLLGELAGAILVFRDISKEREMEKALERQREELNQANLRLEHLNEQKNLLLGMAAHDLRNPLSVILGYAGFLRKQGPEMDGAKSIRFLSNIETSAKFMLRLVEDLLDISALEAGQLVLHRQQVDLGQLADSVVQINRPLADAKSILMELAPQSPQPNLVHADPAKIEQVLTNLITNAIKYSPEGSHIEVKISRDATRASLSVRDHGPGIPPDELHRLFQPFSRTSVKSTGGERSTGLGLAIVQKIAEGHGGSIEVVSRLGEGSEFSLRLPLQPLNSPDESESPRKEEA